MIRIVAAVAVAAMLAACGSPEPVAEPPASPSTTTAAPTRAPVKVPAAVSDTVEVTRVIDGDTIEAGGKTIRLIGIDAPEDGDCYSDEATAELARLIDGENVRLEADPSQAATDRYGRTLAFVFLDERNVGQLLLAGGFVREYTYDDPYRYQRLFKGAEQAARTGSAGLWSACEKPSSAPTPDEAPEDVFYANCTAAREAGAAPLHRGEPGYRSKLDRDNDGIACEVSS